MTTRETADVQERDRDAVAALAFAWYLSFQERIRIALQSTTNPADALTTLFRQLTDSLAYAGIAAWNQSRVRVAVNLANAIAASPELQAYFPTDVKTHLLQMLQAASRETEMLPVFHEEATHYSETLLSYVTALLIPNPPSETVESTLTRAGVLGDGFAVRSLYDSITHDAYISGLRIFNSLPPVSKVFAGFEYVTMRDTRVRPAHRAEDGKFASPTDLPMLLHFQQLLKDWGCRCTLVALYARPGEKPRLL